MDLLSLIFSVIASICIDIIAGIYFLSKKKYKHLWFLVLPFVIIYLLARTNILVEIGIYGEKPKIELVEFREATEREYKEYNDSNYCFFYTDYSVYTIEFSSNIRLEKDRDEISYRFYGSFKRRNFNYQEIIEDYNKTRLQAHGIFYEKTEQGRYYYKAFLQLLADCDITRGDMQKVKTEDITDDLHCKIFFVEMFHPIYGSSEIVIPLDTLKKVITDTSRKYKH